MLVNGLPLPAKLVELLQAGRWKRPADPAILAEMTGAQQAPAFHFDSLDGMIRETAGNVRLWTEGYGHLYSLTSSSEPTAASNPALLNVDRAVIIAGNLNEEVICLDYRESLEEPKILCGVWPDSRGVCQWKVIASTFEAFAERLGL